MRPARIAASVSAAGLALAVLTGCGTTKEESGPPNSSLDAQTLARNTQTAVDETDTIRFSGEAVFTEDGTSVKVGVEACADPGKKAVDAHITADGKPIDVLVVDGKPYIKAPSETWRYVLDLPQGGDDGEDGPDPAAVDELIRLVGDRYVGLGGLIDDFGLDDAEDADGAGEAEESGEPDGTGLFDNEPDAADGSETSEKSNEERLLDLADIDDLFGDDAGSVVKGEPVEYEGRTVIPLTATDKESGDVVTVYVPESGDPIPVRVTLETPGTEQSADVKIETGGEACAPKAPPADQQVDEAAFFVAFMKVLGFDDSDADDFDFDDTESDISEPGTGTSTTGR
ncbi:hypothetical protein [Yinghuangia sp. YIM S10712]|uniref:hypothetical protein n=1 Tax=Yinghuangia sp. YIM S10712 TaxID=3436930 RepID=UPI003F5344DB